jgi:hypothetical protein
VDPKRSAGSSFQKKQSAGQVGAAKLQGQAQPFLNWNADCIAEGEAEKV